MQTWDTRLRRWAVVLTHSHREFVAQANLEQQGFEVFLPSLLTTRRHARRLKTAKTALFPRYVFILIDRNRDRWRCINSTTGVSQLVTTNDIPCPVPSDFVEDLRACVDADGLVALANSAKTGDAVEIMAGPFAGQIGTLQDMTPRGRVDILLNLMQAPLRVSLPQTQIRLAS